MIDLRPYQADAIEAARRAMRVGRRAVLLVAPTGSGKSVILARIAARAPGSVLILVHSSELVAQLASACQRERLDVGLIQATETTSGRVTIASIQTLVARDLRPPADLVLWDEAHHACAPGWSALAAHYLAAGARIVGFTATPERADGIGLGNVFDHLVEVAKVGDLVEGGSLVPVDVIAPDRMLASGAIAEHPRDSVKRYCDGRSTLIFAPNVDTAYVWRAQIPWSEVLTGQTSDADRACFVDDFREGRIGCLISVNALTEGFDAPIASAAIVARGIGSTSVWRQIAGRIMRPHPSKTGALLVDLRGNVHVHGLPDEAVSYALHGKAIRRAGDTPACRFCSVCGAIMGSESACLDCGRVGTATEAPRVVETLLRPLARDVLAKDSPAKRRARFEWWLKEEARRGYKPGWAHARYRGLYGVSP